ncbi:MAG: DUF4149 domain-containing protein [Aquabacterium sp.]|jgi:hypothetical protein|uniref:DUF4149 domain-containing protein n=1 Tax=Aquabacterium sp. TaxID=1872578 RepID=UPI003BB0EB27
MSNRTLRFETWLAGIWAGIIVGVGAVSAPSLFAVLDRPLAGAGAGRIFATEAVVSLVIAIVLFVAERGRVRDRIEAGETLSVMSGPLLIILGALFLTVFGHYAITPMIQAAKAGQPTKLSFGALHGISVVLFWIKGLLVLTLAWRLGALHDSAAASPAQA